MEYKHSSLPDNLAKLSVINKRAPFLVRVVDWQLAGWEVHSLLLLVH